MMRRILSVMIGLMMIGQATHACGDYVIKQAYITDDSSFFYLDKASYDWLIKRVFPNKQFFSPPEYGDRKPMVAALLTAEAADLKQALIENGINKNNANTAVTKYIDKRGEEIGGSSSLHPYRDKDLDVYGFDEQKQSKPGLFQKIVNKISRMLGLIKADTAVHQMEVTILPKEAPKEFTLYLQGAYLYYSWDAKGAVDTWKSLLALPDKDGKYRKTWAAFMIGRVYTENEKYDEARKYLEQCIQLEKNGLKDTLGLSIEAKGLIAFGYFSQKDYKRAMKIYFDIGDKHSLQMLTDIVFEEDKQKIADICRDSDLCKVMLAAACAYPRFYDEKECDKFISKILYSINAENSVALSGNEELFAYFLYANGKYDLARKWIKQQKSLSFPGLWVKYKLQMMDGDLEGAYSTTVRIQSVLRKENAKNFFPSIAESDGINTELTESWALIFLAKQQYVKAFEALANGGLYIDAAYVAEKLLTADELKAELRKPAIIKAACSYGYYESRKEPCINSLRYLLARKLAREGRYKEAFVYIPKKITENVYYYDKDHPVYKYPAKYLSEYLNNLNAGNNIRNNAATRAAGLMEAGRIMNEYGNYIVATELEPDRYFGDDATNVYVSITHRTGIWPDVKDPADWYTETVKILKARDFRPPDKTEYYNLKGVLKASRDEVIKLVNSLPQPLKRYHYRYKAADLMWKAAMLLPNNNDTKARALCMGGLYIKTRDPKAADRFYKALVRTCPKTKLGKRAAEKRWFPEMDI